MCLNKSIINQIFKSSDLELPVQLNESNQHLPANQNRVFTQTMA